MQRTFIRVTALTLGAILFFVYVTKVLTAISGGGRPGAAVAGVNPEAGEAIFWGRGKCGTCHSIGNQGSAIRCPDLGQGSQGEQIFIRAAERARELGLAHPTEYLVQSIANPSAYVVEGFKDEMPIAYRPPISLSPDEIKAVITYLQSQGGEPDPGAVKLPREILEAQARPEEEAFPSFLAEGDQDFGNYLFFDVESNAACAKCHAAQNLETGELAGGRVGPDLSSVAGTRTRAFIIESILDPSAEIASGFEPYLAITSDGRFLSGILQEETADSVVLIDQNANQMRLAKAELDTLAQQQTSLMPGNFSEILTVEEFRAIIAFLQTQTGEEAPAAGRAEQGRVR